MDQHRGRFDYHLNYKEIVCPFSTKKPLMWVHQNDYQSNSNEDNNVSFNGEIKQNYS